MGGFQRAVMQSKLALKLVEVMVLYSVYSCEIRVSGSHWKNLVIRCLIVVMYFYGYLLVIMEIKIMIYSQ